MKKFYPEEYFKRAGYEYNPYNSGKNGEVQLKRGPSAGNL